jgi:acetyltransferase-like isoleucine patch superfamily enzyme
MISIAKFALNAVAATTVSPAVVAYRLSRMAVGTQRAFPGWSQTFALVPGLTGAYLRRAFYRRVLPRCGDGCWIGFAVVFSHATAEIGRNVYVGPFCCLGDVTLEDDVLLGSHVSVTNGSAQHGTERLDIPIREQPGVWPRVTIGRDTWIGDRAVIMADVGAHCVIGAGAVVTKPIPDYAVAMGVPARIVRYRNQPPGPSLGVDPNPRPVEESFS